MNRELPPCGWAFRVLVDSRHARQELEAAAASDFLVTTLKLYLLFIGKPRSREANLLAQEYASRIQHYCRFEMVQLKDERGAAAYGKALRIVLDPSGEQWTSRQLAGFLEKAGRDVAFFVGGAEGFSDRFRQEADRLLSLSKMTLPHELARVLLAEQIYRAFTILRGHPYPR